MLSHLSEKLFEISTIIMHILNMRKYEETEAQRGQAPYGRLASEPRQS